MKSTYYIILMAAVVFCSCNHKTAPESLINEKASLPDTFQLSGLHLKVLTSVINKNDSTTSVLYGNAAAERMLDSDKTADTTASKFVLVTWRQQPDKHWFGARIPGNLVAVEQLQTNGANGIAHYEKFTGKKLTRVTDTAGEAGRIKFILSQKVSFIP